TLGHRRIGTDILRPSEPPTAAGFRRSELHPPPEFRVAAAARRTRPDRRPHPEAPCALGRATGTRGSHAAGADPGSALLPPFAEPYRGVRAAACGGAARVAGMASAPSHRLYAREIG